MLFKLLEVLLLDLIPPEEILIVLELAKDLVVPVKVDFLSVRSEELNGLYPLMVQKSVGAGTLVMMQVQEHIKYQDAPDGLYLHRHNSRTLDTAVDPSGVHHLASPPLLTGPVVRTLFTTPATVAV